MAADLYEQAVRADAIGKHVMAQTLATQALEASPSGPYAPALHRLLDRIAGEMLFQQPPQEDHTPARIAYVLSAGLAGALAGFALSLGLADHTQADVETIDGAAIGGITLVGAIIGVTAALATMRSVNDGSLSLHLWAGATYGAWLSTSLVLLTQLGSPGGVGAAIGGGIAAGAILDTVLAATVKLTPGGGAASFTLGNAAAFAIVAFEVPFASSFTVTTVAASMLVASTLGFVGGELLNSRIHWSSARWGLIILSSILGLAVGGAVAVAANSGWGATAILGAGSLIGLGVGAAATTGMAPETREPSAPAAPAALAPPAQAPRAMFSLAF